MKYQNRVQEVLEELGIFSITNLEKLADSFTNVKYSIYPNNESPNEGRIEFIYTGQWIFQKNNQEIRNITNKFYNENDYFISVSTSDKGFNLFITKNFINDLFDKHVN